jgi:4-coumarate--CoA ligase
MPYKSRWSVPIPNTSIPTFIFGPPGTQLSNDKVALADAARPEYSLTPASWYLWSKRIAVGLRNAGMQPGDRVLLFSGNYLFFPVLFMGVLLAEGVFTGANPTYVARELAHQLRDSGATFLVTADDGGSLETAMDAAAQVGLPSDRIFIFNDECYDGKGDSRLGIRHWNALIASKAEGEAFVPLELLDPKSTTSCLNYSSGTTGVAKGVQISHYNYIANTIQVTNLAQQDPEYERKNREERWLCFLPMYHAMGQAVFIISAPSRGIPVYIMKKFDFIQMLENIEKFKISELFMVPPIVVTMAKHPASRKYDLSSVRKILSGAAPLGREVSVELESLWPKGDVNVKQGWGQTEVTCSLLGWDPTQTSDSSSVGELNANCEAKIMNEEGTEEVPRGERGELYVRGENVMMGYWNNPKATAGTFTADGWLKTGDICFINERGHFTVVDRLKELIKVKGYQVAPAELEALLLDHPDISDAAVIGVHIEGDELPRAYVVLQPGGKAKPHEIATWLSPRVARHKRLLGGVKIVESIPKNPSGKILRKMLRERAIKELGNSISETSVRTSRL